MNMNRLVQPNSCRLCAGFCENSIPIFENTGALAEKIKSYLHVEIKNLKNLDEVPKMCSACYKKIITWDQYVEQVKKVQGMFLLLTDSQMNVNMVEKCDTKITGISKKPTMVVSEEKANSIPEPEELSLDETGPKSTRLRQEQNPEKQLQKHDTEFSDEDDVPLANQLESSKSALTNKDKKDQVKTKPKGKIKTVKVERPKEPDKSIGKTNEDSCVIYSDKEKDVNVEVEKDDDDDDCNRKNYGNGVKRNDTNFVHRNSPDTCEPLPLFVWECLQCQAPVKNWNALTKHCKIIHGSNGAVKCICGKVLHSRASVVKHRAKHTVGYEYKCEYENCNKTYHKQNLLDVHSLSHLPKELQPWMCCKCSRRFHTESLLKQHEKVHLPKEEKLIHPCGVCQKKFCSKSAVASHIRAVHFGERPFVCDQCGHSFTSKGILHEHLTIHSDVYNFHCKDCSKSFKTKYRLKIHMDTHVETKYQCPVCSLSLNTRRTLRMHLLVHKDEKAFQCTTCGKAFKRSKDLKNHYNLHTGSRPYTCPFCQRTFANGSNCRSHKRRMHPEELKMYEAAVAADRRGGQPSVPDGPQHLGKPSGQVSGFHDSDESNPDISDFKCETFKEDKATKVVDNPPKLYRENHWGVDREDKPEITSKEEEAGGQFDVSNFYPMHSTPVPAFPGNPFFRH